MFKKCYQLDKNGYFVSETIQVNEGLPAGCIDVAPPEIVDGFIPQWNGEEWEQIENHKGKEGYIDGIKTEIKEYGPLPDGWSDTPPPPTFEELKQAKINEINQLRDKQEQGGFEYNGSIFDSDSISYERLMGATVSAQIAMMAGAEFPPIEWTLQNNSSTTLTAQDFMQIIPAFAAYSGMLHAKASALKEQINKAETEEELALIVWE